MGKALRAHRGGAGERGNCWEVLKDEQEFGAEGKEKDTAGTGMFSEQLLSVYCMPGPGVGIGHAAGQSSRSLPEMRAPGVTAR